MDCGYSPTQSIPGLAASSPGAGVGTPDVQVWLDSPPEWLNEAKKSEPRIRYVSNYRDEHGEPTMKVWELADGAYFWLRYNDGTEFVINRPGTRIWAAWPDTLTLEDAATYLLGPILGFVLLLRGIVCLHASAIAVGVIALALLGPAGAGKSTTAAMFPSWRWMRGG